MQAILAILGAILYRWRGSSLPKPPRPVLQALIALPFACTLLPHPCLAVLCFLLTTAALCLGHGQYQSMGLSKVSEDRSSVDFLIRRFFPNDSSGFCHCAAGMALTGLLVTLPAGLLTLSPLLAVSGALKAVAYFIGVRLAPRLSVLGDTAECLAGAVFWGIAAFYILGS